MSLRRGWAGYAAAVWCAVFAAPHVWWALGIPWALPGGEIQALRGNRWFLAYDLLVVLLCVVGAAVALATVRPWGRSVPRRWVLGLGWLGSALLTGRGLAGLVADGRTDLVWWPAFLVGGVLFAAVCWRYRRGSAADRAVR